MQLQMATLADAASVREGLLHALGMGVTRVFIVRFPARPQLVVPVIVAATLEELQDEHELKIDIVQPDGTTVRFGRVGIGLEGGPMPEDASACLNLLHVVPLNLYTLPEPGDYRVVVQLDDQPPFALAFQAAVVDVDGEPEPDVIAVDDDPQP